RVGPEIVDDSFVRRANTNLRGLVESPNVLKHPSVASRVDRWPHLWRSGHAAQRVSDLVAQVDLSERQCDASGQIGNDEWNARLRLLQSEAVTQDPFVEQALAVVG